MISYANVYIDQKKIKLFVVYLVSYYNLGQDYSDTDLISHQNNTIADLP
jgi:hypothetical protein